MIDIDALYEAIVGMHDTFADEEGVKEHLRKALSSAWTAGYRDGLHDGPQGVSDMPDPYREES